MVVRAQIGNESEKNCIWFPWGSVFGVAENEEMKIVKLFVDGFEFCKKILKGLLKWHVESVKIFCPPPTRALDKIHEGFQYVNSAVG